jgi:murein DD-endopeptidase MepM/ murein hydrolase activator NlpD
MRRGVWLLVFAAALAAALGVASARAEGHTGATTTTTGTTTTTPAPSYSPLAASYLRADCIGAGTAAIAVPGRPTLVVGTPAANRGPSSYPGKVPVLTFDSSAATGSTCRTSRVTLESVSLFGGAVRTSSVAAAHGKGTVNGLEVDGSPVSLRAGETIEVGFWGQLTLASRVGRLTAPLVVHLLRRHYSLPAGTTIAVGFAASARPVAKTKATHHSSAGSTQPTQTTPTGSVASPKPKAKKHRHKKHVPQPLKRTPPLGFRPSHYVFPVDGGASYVDTYGANRSDVYDGWHHGDDLFAPLGTPVVAVANGTLSLVGWNKLGGWRLWLTDGDGNSFYYAHLAAYSRWILDHPNVRAGQVVGFLGRTGDAFGTTPHLHFEIHPHQYLDLDYDGAVDPTAYLQKWRVVRVRAKVMPRPAKLKAPKGVPAEEASVVWHELLVARHLLPTNTDGPAGAMRRTLRQPTPLGMRGLEASGAPLRIADLRRASAHVAATTSSTSIPWLGGGVSGGVLLALSAGAFALYRRRRAADETSS